jgi:hypothetical protein
VSSTYAGDVVGILTAAETARVRHAYASATAPRYSFPAWDWSWVAADASTLTD